MFSAIEDVLPRWEVTLQHDNARPHVARTVTAWLEHQHINILKQPPYSPDTNLLDRYVFRNYETYRRGNDFANSNELENSVDNFLNSLTPAQMEKEFAVFKQHLQKVIDSEGDYIK